MDRKQILDKVIKLLALSENNSETEEAKSAKDMAAKLMAKHDISIMEAEKKPEFKTIHRALTRLSPIKYDSGLIITISSFNGVGYVVQKGYKTIKGKNVFIGRESDIQINDYMLEIVFQQRSTAWKEYLAQYKADWKRSPKAADKENFMFGFIFGIRAKLDSLVALKNDKIQEYGLVPVDTADVAIAEYKKDNDCRTSKSRPKSFNQDGYDAGKNTAIHKGINKQSDTKLIG